MSGYPKFQVDQFLLDETNGIYVQDEDHDTSPSLMLDTFSIARRPGGKVVSSTYQPKKIPLKGTIVGTSYADLEAKMDAFKAACLGTFHTYYHDNGTTCKSFSVSLTGSAAFSRSKKGPVCADFSLIYQVNDAPWGKAATLGGSPTTTTAINDSNVTVDIYTNSVTFAGSAPPAAAVTITVTTPGDLTSLQFADITNSRTLTITPSGTIRSGDIIVIDASVPSVLLNNAVVPFSGQFPEWQAAASNIAVYAYTTSGTTLDQSQTLTNNSQVLFKTTQVIAESWTTSASGGNPLSRLAFILNKVGSPTGTITITVKNDNGSGTAPGATTQGTPVTIASPAVSSIFQYATVPIPSFPLLAANTKYWFLITVGSGCDISNYYQVRSYTNNPAAYAGGGLFLSADSGSTYAAVTNTSLAFKAFRSVQSQSNQTVDADSYSEGFTATTYKDGAHAASNWDTSGHQVVQVGASTNDSYVYASDTTTNNCFGNTTTKYVGFRFTTNNNGHNEVLDSVTFKMSTGASPASAAVAVEIYNDLVSAGASVGSFIAASTTSLNLNALTTTPTVKTFSFSGVTLAPNTSYVIMASCPGALSGSRLIIQSDWTTFGASYSSQNLYVVASTLAILTNYAGGTTGLPLTTVSTHYLDYTAAEDNRSLTLNTSAADLIYATPSFPNNGVGTAPVTVSANGGTNFEGTGVQGTQVIFTNNGTDLRWKALLTGTANVAAAIQATAAVAYNVGVALNATTVRASQSFVQPSNGNIQRVDLYGTHLGTPGDVTVRIETDSGGSPSGTLVNAGATGTIATASYTAGAIGFVTANLGTAATLVGGTTYHIVAYVTVTANSTNKWLLQANNGLYSSGAMKKSTNSGTSYAAPASGEDLVFRTFGTSGSNFAYNIALTYIQQYA